MGFELLSTGWLYAAPGFLGALVLLYFLKLKRREVAVSSTYLWRAALDDMRVNSPLQRLRMNLMLLLQALALLLLLLALARPVSQLGLAGTDTILLLDVSASMKATDGTGGRTRFEQARAEARRVVEDLSRGDRAIVIAYSDEARVLTPMTNSKAALRAALDDLRPTDRPTRLAEALHRVNALVAGAERTPALYVFTDGGTGPLDGVALDERVPLHYIRVGDATDNVGIVGLDVRPASGLGEETRAFVSVLNAGAAEVEVGVDFHVDGALLGSTSVKIGPGGVAQVPYETTTSQGRLEVRLDHTDALPADDVAHALLRPQEPVRVLLVTPGNLFLDSALREDPLVWKNARGEVPVLTPDALSKDDPALLEYDLIVLDRASPEDLPPGNYLCFATRPPFPRLVDEGSMNEWKTLDWDEAHEVARFVNFSTLLLPTAQRFALRDGDVEVVRGNHGPLVFEARDGDRRALVCAFDLMSLPVEGAWTFDPSYPIFLANAVRWLGGAGRDKKDLLVRTGGVAELRFPAAATRATVTPPPGGAPYDVTIRPGDDVLRLAGLDQAGIYTVAIHGAGGGEPLRTSLFAANLADADESRIAPAPKLELPGRPAALAQARAVEQNQDMWKLFALVALGVVLVEWWIYNRRVFI
ncbi:MAG: VWA domain-containing protein [Planctomycetes bacterium]|nr:VWA domain-containing protein [Planctomycetota bacterium]